MIDSAPDADGRSALDVQSPGAANRWVLPMVSQGIPEAIVKWVTRHHPKVDRIACPWLIKRFVDHDAEFIYVPPEHVLEIARTTGAIPYDVDGVELTHNGPLCSFDAILKKYKLADPALQEMATVIRGADTNRLDLSRLCPGVYAILIGLSRTHKDDHEQLKDGMAICEALYAWCKQTLQTQAALATD